MEGRPVIFMAGEADRLKERRLSAGPWALSAGFVGAVVGGGYASGQEIFVFFTRYGSQGLGGMLLAGLLFALLGGAVLVAVQAHGIRNYAEFLEWALGAKGAAFYDAVLSAFLFAGLSITLAGGGALLYQVWGLPALLGGTSLALLTALCLIAGVRGFLAANTILVPFLILVSLGVAWPDALLTLRRLDDSILPGIPPAASAFNYVSYNMLIAVVALASSGSAYRLSSRAAFWYGAAGGLALGTLGLLLALALQRHAAGMPLVEVPLARIAAGRGAPWPALYNAGLLVALLTTSLANTLGLTARLAGSASGRTRWMILILLAALPLASLGFANLVRTLYPLAGYLGAVLILALLFRLAGRGNGNRD